MGLRLMLPFFTALVSWRRRKAVGSLGPSAEPVLESLQHPRVDLAHPRLREMHDLPDLPHRELLPVLQVDDPVLLHGEALGDEAQDLVAGQAFAGGVAVE